MSLPSIFYEPFFDPMAAERKFSVTHNPQYHLGSLSMEYSNVSSLSFNTNHFPPALFDYGSIRMSPGSIEEIASGTKIEELSGAAYADGQSPISVICTPCPTEKLRR